MATTLAAPGAAPGVEQTPGVALGSLSPSRAADFMTCPLLYRFRTIDRLAERPSTEAARGTLVHAVLERLFDLPANERRPAAARALVRPQWQQMRDARPELADLFAGDDGALAAWLHSAEDLVEGYFELEDPSRLEPAERELGVETVLGSGLRLRGYVDRLDVAADGSVRVVDYKSGRAPPAGAEARAMFQMRFYALVLWRASGRVPSMLQLLYLGSGERLRYAPDEADLRATERKVEALAAAIRLATVTGDWRASPSPRCGSCAFRALCPAWGGTPPPLPAAVVRAPAPPSVWQYGMTRAVQLGRLLAGQWSRWRRRVGQRR